MKMRPGDGEFLLLQNGTIYKCQMIRRSYDCLISMIINGLFLLVLELLRIIKAQQGRVVFIKHCILNIMFKLKPTENYRPIGQNE